MKTLLFLLLSATAFAQPSDTLFFKDFNDNNPFSNSPGNKGNFSVSPPYTLQPFVDNQALVCDIAKEKTRMALSGAMVPPSMPLFNLQTTALGYDTITVEYQLVNTMGTPITTTNSMGITIMRPFSSPLLLNYSNPTTGKTFTNAYHLGWPPSLELAFMGYGMPVSTSTVQKVNYTQVISKYYANTANIYLTLNSRSPFPTDKVFLSGNNLNGMPIDAAQLKPILLKDFCPTTDDSTDCKKNVFFNVVPSPSPEIIRIDDVIVLGKKKLVTGWETAFVADEPKKILKAYTLLGQEIQDLPTYKGAAVVYYTDGSKAKIVR